MCRENNSMGDIQQLYLTGMVPAGGCFVKIHSLLDGEWVAVIPALSSGLHTELIAKPGLD